MIQYQLVTQHKLWATGLTTELTSRETELTSCFSSREPLCATLTSRPLRQGNVPAGRKVTVEARLRIQRVPWKIVSIPWRIELTIHLTEMVALKGWRRG